MVGARSKHGGKFWKIQISAHKTEPVDSRDIPDIREEFTPTSLNSWRALEIVIVTFEPGGCEL